ncbi:MAG: phage holin family protein [Rhodobacterales bacterium]|nr:MAG: phage holin family protein [Rhodobacterales bacterium]
MTERLQGTDPDRGTAGLFADVLSGVSRLVQGELELARAEATERLHRLRRSAVQCAVALVLGITSVNVLAGAAVAAIVALGLSPTWASVTVGGVLLLIALGFAQHAAQLMRDVGTLPRRSSASLKRDVEILSSGVRSDGQA